MVRITILEEFFSQYDTAETYAGFNRICRYCDQAPCAQIPTKLISLHDCTTCDWLSYHSCGILVKKNAGEGMHTRCACRNPRRRLGTTADLLADAPPPTVPADSA